VHVGYQDSESKNAAIKQTIVRGGNGAVLWCTRIQHMMYCRTYVCLKL